MRFPDDRPTQGPEVVVCLVTAPPDDAGRVAAAMLERELAACVNIVEGARSLAASLEHS